jgi:hypothetical protein
MDALAVNDVMLYAIPVISTADAIPVFSWDPAFYGHGFGIGLAASLLMSQLAQCQPALHRSNVVPF